MTKRCLVVGASGQVGHAISAAFADWTVSEAQRTPGHGQLIVDLTDEASILEALSASKPQLVVIAGAWTWVDGAEDQPEVCFATNVRGPERIAEWCEEHGATVVYYSTDHVFDGSGNPHSVDDPVNPLNVYAKSKVEGESAIRRATPDHLILRTAWVYGPDVREKNFAMRLVRSMESGDEVAVPADQWGTPTYAPDLASVTHRLIEEGKRGTFQVVGPDYLSRRDLAERVCESFGLHAEQLRSVDTASLGQRARRPLEVRMDTTVIDAIQPHAIRGVDEGLAALADWHRSRSDDD